ncbi:MAG: GHKL domain-containing protein [Actinobacteria bacterium]|nr:GHKL domain-containing protein [Actinomycetota bacterium]
MLGPRALRSKLDRIRSRVDGRPAPTSRSVGDAVDRLEESVVRHLAGHEAESAAAARLTRAFDLIPQGIVLADASARVVFRNRAASGFVDARHGEALVEAAMSDLVALAVDGVSETRTIDLFGPPRRAIELRAGPLRADPDADDGQVVGAFLIVDDVSERQRVDAVRRDFVANISHELKTPVGALGVLAETLAGEDDPEVVARLADRMQLEAFRVARTIDDLLQLSQIESDVVGERAAVVVDDVIAAAVERTRTAAEVAGVQVVAPSVERDLLVLGDRMQLVSALSNLCENAIKYSEAGDQVQVLAERDGSWASITVADSGVGIPTRDLERIFERFYRVDRARSRDTGGTGLGLSIVRHVVQNHHGEITVRSREGSGSTFTVRVPLLDTPSEPSPEPLAASRRNP